MTTCNQLGARAEPVRRIWGREGMYAQQRAGWTRDECKRKRRRVPQNLHGLKHRIECSMLEDHCNMNGVGDQGASSEGGERWGTTSTCY